MAKILKVINEHYPVTKNQSKDFGEVVLLTKACAIARSKIPTTVICAY